MNDAPIGLRIERGAPLPNYQHTYPNTDDGLEQANADMERIREYVTKWEDWTPPKRKPIKEIL
jgi:proline dehydrogenase